MARFLYYMNPREASLEFVRDKEKTRRYLRELHDAKLTNQTQLNYLKSLKRLVAFGVNYWPSCDNLFLFRCLDVQLISCYSSLTLDVCSLYLVMCNSFI